MSSDKILGFTIPESETWDGGYRTYPAARARLETYCRPYNCFAVALEDTDPNYEGEPEWLHGDEPKVWQDFYFEASTQNPGELDVSRVRTCIDRSDGKTVPITEDQAQREFN